MCILCILNVKYHRGDFEKFTLKMHIVHSEPPSQVIAICFGFYGGQKIASMRHRSRGIPRGSSAVRAFVQHEKKPRRAFSGVWSTYNVVFSVFVALIACQSL